MKEIQLDNTDIHPEARLGEAVTRFCTGLTSYKVMELMQPIMRLVTPSIQVFITRTCELHHSTRVQGEFRSRLLASLGHAEKNACTVAGPGRYRPVQIDSNKYKKILCHRHSLRSSYYCLTLYVLLSASEYLTWLNLVPRLFLQSPLTSSSARLVPERSVNKC